MADRERLASSLQESIATAIALVDDTNSIIVANAIESMIRLAADRKEPLELFDSPFDDIVSRCLEYRRKNNRPPGKSHIDDIFSDILEDPDHKQFNLINRILNSMVRQVDGLDTGFIANRTSDFINLKMIRSSIATAADLYQKGGTNVFDNIRTVFTKALRIGNNAEKDYGFTLADPRALGFLDRDESEYCLIGIPELDLNGVHPARKEMLVFLAARNKGKSQFLGHCGKFGLLKGWEVAHYTLENSDVMTSQRYFQSLFNGVRREDSDHRYSRFVEEKGVVRLHSTTIKPNFIIEDREAAREFLRKQQKGDIYDTIAARLANLRIRRFASGRLSFDDLQRDLDELDLLYKFRPKMLLLDMPQLMRINRRLPRNEALSDLVTDLRGLGVERDMAVVVPQQGNRAAEDASTVRGSMGGGTIDMLGIADNAIVHSQTASEEEHGIARMYAQKVRNDKARFTVVITQHYASGQFCMDSRLQTNELLDIVKTYVGNKPEEEAEIDEDEDRYSRRRAN